MGSTCADSSYGRGEGSIYPAGNNVILGQPAGGQCQSRPLPQGERRLGPHLGQAPELILPKEDKDIDTGNVSDYNVFYRSDGRGIPFWKGWDNLVGKDLAQWQQKSGQDKHSVVADPKFVDAAKLDFHLKADSPVLWMVKPSMGVVTDYEGKYRPIEGFAAAQAYFTAGALEPDPAIAKRGGLHQARRGWAIRPGQPAQGPHPDPLRIRFGRLFPRRGLRCDDPAEGQEHARQDGRGTGRRAFRAIYPIAGDRAEQGQAHGDHSSGQGRQEVAHSLCGRRAGKEGPAVECVVKREDGKSISLVWEAGKTLAPCWATGRQARSRSRTRCQDRGGLGRRRELLRPRPPQ